MARLFKCSECGFETEHEYYDEGIIAHENLTSDWNCNAMLFREGLEELCKIPNGRSINFTKHVILHRRGWILKNHPELITRFEKTLVEFGF